MNSFQQKNFNLAFIYNKHSHENVEEYKWDCERLQIEVDNQKE